MATVDSVQTSSTSLMNAQYSQVATFLSFLRSLSFGVQTYTPPSIVTSLVPASLITTSALSRPSRPTHNPAEGAMPPGEPDFESAQAVPEGIPTFSGVAPAVDAGAAPTPAMPSAPAQISLDGVPALPTAPTTTLPQAPTFSPVAIPEELGYEIPEFSFAVPVSTLTAPTNTFAFSEEEYSSALSDELQAQLLADMENGTYGINSDVEQLLWDRARARTGAESNALVEEALRTAADRGFPLPPGASMATIAAAQQQALTNLATVDREIALKRADMYVEGRKTTLALVKETEQMFITYRSALVERSLNAAKAVAEVGIAMFNARREAFVAELDAYKTYATVFESKIRAESIKVEIFKTRMEAARVGTEAQRVAAEVYRTQIEGVTALANVYRTQMEAVKVSVDVGRAKVEAYRAQVEAYVAQIQARNAEYDGYKARIQGEVAKVSGFEAQARAYAAEVDGYRARAQAAEANAKIIATNNQGRAEIFKTQVDAYRAELEKAVAESRVEAEYYKADSSFYASYNQIQAESAKVAVSINEANSRIVSKGVDQAIQSAKDASDASLRTSQLSITASKAGADSATALAVAAANQITGLTSLLAESAS